MSNEHDCHFSNWIVIVIIISITVLSFYYQENYHHLYTYINFNFHHNYRIICIHFSLKQFFQLIFFRLEACYSIQKNDRRENGVYWIVETIIFRWGALDRSLTWILSYKLTGEWTVVPFYVLLLYLRKCFKFTTVILLLLLVT